MFKLLPIAPLLIPFVAFGQPDSLATDTGRATQPTERVMILGNQGEGTQLVIQNTDTTEVASDTLRINTRHKSIVVITSPRSDRDTVVDFDDELARLRRKRRQVFTYWGGLELGMNTLITEDGRWGSGPKSDPMVLSNGRSRFFAINFVEKKIEFGTHHVGLLTGLGIEFNNYRLSTDDRLAFDNDSTFLIPRAEGIGVKKNKLRQIGIRLPLMLEFNTASAHLPGTKEELASRQPWSFSRKNNFHFAAGVVGTLFFDTMYKQRYSEDGHSKRYRDKGNYNLVPYRLAARAQLGWGSLNLFAEYGLTPLFERGAAPEMSALNVGITLLGFN